MVHRLFAALVLMSLAAGPAAAQPAGRWLAEDIAGSGVLDGAQTTLEFTGDGRVAGGGGCNRYFGAVRIEGATMAFGQMGSTRMACPPAIMDQEAKFFRALEAVRSWRMERGKLLLLDEKGTAVLRLAHEA